MTVTVKLPIKYTRKERFEIFLEHQEKPLEWFQTKFKISESTLWRFKAEAVKKGLRVKKGFKRIITTEEGGDKEDDRVKIPVPDTINQDYIEQCILNIYNREDIDRVKLMIDFLYKRAKFDNKKIKKKVKDLGVFLNESIE